MSIRRLITSYLPVILRYGTLQRHPLLRSIKGVQTASIAKRILYSPEHGFCYFRIPKAGSSTVLVTLGNAIYGRDVTPAFVQARHHRIPSPVEASQAFAFTVVRNPKSRVLSTYLDKSRSPSMRKKHDFLAYKPGSREGFQHFLDALEAGELMSNTHWAPQSSILPFSQQQLDYVGRFENFDDDLAHCMSAIFGREIGIRTHRPHKTQSRELMHQFIEPKAQQQIRRLYLQDFERFYPGDL